MLQELHVKDFALIEEAWLEFDPGMTVLTGETGAGKTALIGALKLLIGERGDSQMVRANALEALVEGRILIGAEEFVARRRLTSDGRSRCTINDEMATVGSLGQTLGPIIDLHGQHEHQALLQPVRHVAYLDRSIGDEAAVALEDYRKARERHRSAVCELEGLHARLAETSRQAEYLRFVVRDVDGVQPVEGEDAEIEARLPALRHGERLAIAASEAYARVHGEGGASDSLGAALAALSKVAGIDPALEDVAGRLDAHAAMVEELAAELREYGERIEHDSGILDQAESRAAALSAIKKKYGPTLADVLCARDRAQTALDALDSGDRELAEAEKAEESARCAVRDAGARLHALRTDAVPAFVARLADEARALAMEGARFDVGIEELPFEDWTHDGPCRLEFLYAPAPKQPLRALSRIASGGEVSRVMLALKSVLGANDDVPVLVFDEIDAGVGGTTALAVGERLASLARDHQVIVVTHLPQVAAYATRHLVVTKVVEDDGVHTSVSAVEGDSRVAEIARMLAGIGTEASQAHAVELLETTASAS